jgi:hypothetical protein
VKFIVVPPGEAPPPKRRRRSQPVVQKRASRVFLGAIAGVVLALGVFGAVAWQRLDRFGADASSAQRSIAGEEAPSAQKISEDARPIYRYSVVPGGVRSPEELIEAMARDSAVAEHYAGIDKAKLTNGRLSEPLQAHVSYRIGDRVYWTKKKLTIQAGEQVLTDGKTIVRGRCGNNLSVAPLLPTLDNEPKPDVFDLIVLPLQPNTLVQLDPAHSYFTPRDLKTPQVPGSGTGSGLSSVGGFPGPPPPGHGTPATLSTQPSGAPTPNGVPPGGNPPGAPPDNPPGNPCEATAATISSAGGHSASPSCAGNPPGDPPGDVTPHDVPNTPTPVPEPGTLFLVAAGAAALLAHRIRRQAR